MTDKEKAIVMAHTGICMLTGDKFRIFHKYVEDILDRPIMTHEFAPLADEIKEKSKADFIALCADESPNKTGHWIEHPHEWGNNWEYSQYECSVCHNLAHFDTDFCPNCGIEMKEIEK